MKRAFFSHVFFSNKIENKEISVDFFSKDYVDENKIKNQEKFW